MLAAIVEPYRLEITMPGLPKTMNARLHWRARYRENQLWLGMVQRLVATKIPEYPLPTARLVCVRYSSQEPDYDNLTSGFKPIIDALVKCKVLKNDKMRNIGMPDFRWEKVPIREGKVRVVVLECLSKPL